MTRDLSPLTTPEAVLAFVNTIKDEKIIAFDTEFIRESTFYPVTELIQVASRTVSAVIDVQAFREDTHGKAGLQPLLDIFENQSILKIAHAAVGDQECLYTAFGIVASPILDTAIAASLTGRGDGIGLSNLLKFVMGVELKKGHARTNWSKRPLPDQLLEYAHADVTHLVELAEKMLAELDALERRPWALELSLKTADPKLYAPTPEEIAERLGRGGKLDAKGFSVLMELVRWREERVRRLNLPRRWVADDAVLIDIARVKPKDLNHLSQFRGLNRGEMKSSAEPILNAIRTGEANAANVKAPERGRSITPANAEEDRVLDLLQCFVGLLADRHRIAPKHLMTSAQLLPVLRFSVSHPSEWVTAGLMSEGAAEIIGPEVLSFLQGKRTLRVVPREKRFSLEVVEQ